MATEDSCSVACSWPMPKEKLQVLQVAELEEFGYRGPLKPEDKPQVQGSEL